MENYRLNDSHMETGIIQKKIEKSYQKKYNIQWAWADSLATNASSVFEQLITAKENQIELLETDLKAGLMKVGENIEAFRNLHILTRG